MDCNQHDTVKVLMLTCQYMPDVYGGAEKQCYKLSQALQRNGAAICLLTSLQKKHAKFNDDLDISRIYTGKAPDLLGRWIVFSIYWFIRVLIWGIKNRNTYDVIHCHQGKFGGFVGCFLGLCVRKPVLIKVGNSEQDMDFLCLRRKFIVGPLFFRFILQRQPYIVAISETIARNVKEVGFKKIIRIPNGVVNAVVDEALPSRVVDETPKQINLFYHGRVEKIKRVHLLVEALHQINSPRIHLHIVGDGDELKRVKQCVEHLGLQAQVSLHGQLENIVDHISQWDIFVNASEAEGFSNSLLEALSVGKVMVSTNVSGASDAIDEGRNGYIAASGTVRSLAETINKAIILHKNASEKVKAECEKKIKEVFDIDLVAKRYIQLYEEIM